MCYFTFSGCLRNAYGENCTGTCPVNCLNDICDIISGTCFFCDTGFKGPRCENGLQNIDSFKYNEQTRSNIILMLYYLITRLFYVLLMTFMCINIFIWNLFLMYLIECFLCFDVCISSSVEYTFLSGLKIIATPQGKILRILHL